MSDEIALLAAIRANPDEDTPRLVYADWLDEHACGDSAASNEARAEFIRAQCEFARVEDADPDRTEQLSARVDELVAKFGPGWAKGFPHTPGKPLRFWRGF